MGRIRGARSGKPLVPAIGLPLVLPLGLALGLALGWWSPTLAIDPGVAHGTLVVQRLVDETDTLDGLAAAPSAPSDPSAPSAPSDLSAPSAPSVPFDSCVPSAPSVPSVPSAASAPHEIIPLTHAFAQVRDDAEGLLPSARVLRLAVVDRDIPQSSLDGLGILPIEDLARLGEVRGLLLALDPDHPDPVSVTLLLPPADRAEGAGATVSVPADSTWQVSIGTQSVAAAMRYPPESVDASASATPRTENPSERTDDRSAGMANVTAGSAFSPVTFEFRMTAPLFTETPVTADLLGEAALSSPQAQALQERAAAVLAGDFESFRALTSGAAISRM
ncbi:MAG: hypothetical protein KC729_14300, partial [Candidatus Eisenbacteria bacterium]|nr:hypothetical protein [Candidatus Eisenbacteria bacterium]